MKRVILTKTSNKPVIAHLYEHLYCRALTELFRRHELMRYLDYDYWAKQYHGGFVHLEVRLYTEQAARLAGKFVYLDLPLDDESLGICARQISAERQQRLSGNPDRVVASLKQLHQQPWVNLEELGLYDALSIRRSSLELWHGKPQPRLFRILRCELILDRIAVQDRKLLPLFHVLANILGDNIADGLVENYGYYYENSSGSEYSARTGKQVFTFRASREAVPSLTDELDVCGKDISFTIQIGLVSKLMQFLQTATYSTVWRAPDELKAYEATGVLIGAAGWRDIATEANIEKLLRHTTLRLRLGRETKESSPLA